MSVQFELAQSDVQETTTDCIVVEVYQDATLSFAAQAVDEASDGALRKVLEAGDFSGRKKTHLWLYHLPGVASPRVLLLGLGKQKDFDALAFRTACEHAAEQLAEARIESATTWLAELDLDGRDCAWKTCQAALAVDRATYRFKITNKDDEQRKRLARLAIAGDDACKAGLQRAAAIAEGTQWTRDLANTPPNICTPAWLAGEAERIAMQNETVQAESFGPDELRELGANALLAVGGGSVNTPRLIVLQYRGAGDAKPYALVGKGVTFDAGGLNIKPTGSMEEMKFDMGGAAGVMGTFLAAVKLGLKLNLVCVVASAENVIGAASYRPSDVLQTMSGQTVEVLNTDAEGRLCLCDALHYVRRFEPQAIVDAATLTGACVAALGKHATGLMSQDDELADELLAAGETSLDRAWRLPLWDVYQEALESDNADFANLGGRWGGAITAGCFLSRFTKGYRWAHLDVAGTAWTEGRKARSTGRPVPLLVEWLASKAD